MKVRIKLALVHVLGNSGHDVFMNDALFLTLWPMEGVTFNCGDIGTEKIASTPALFYSS